MGTSVSDAEHTLLLVKKLSELKRQEGKVREERYAVEREISDALAFRRAEGSETFNLHTDRGAAKVSLKQNVYTKVDESKVPQARKALGRTLFSKLFRTKHEVNAKELGAVQALKEKDKERWNSIMGVLSDMVTKTPGKVTVEIKNLEVV